MDVQGTSLCRRSRKQVQPNPIRPQPAVMLTVMRSLWPQPQIIEPRFSPGLCRKPLSSIFISRKHSVQYSVLRVGTDRVVGKTMRHGHGWAPPDSAARHMSDGRAGNDGESVSNSSPRLPGACRRVAPRGTRREKDGPRAVLCLGIPPRSHHASRIATILCVRGLTTRI